MWGGQVRRVYSNELPSEFPVCAFQVEDLKAPAMESAGDEPSSLAKLALWPLSCIQWCRPAMTRPAVDMAVAVVVHVSAAAAALSASAC